MNAAPHARAAWRHLRDLLLPRDCLACEAALPGGWPREVCDGCLEAFESLSFEGVPVCPGCGVPMGPPRIGAAGTACRECRTRPRSFDAARCFGKYDGVLRDAVLRFKFEPVPSLARPLGILAARAAAWVPGELDLVTAVPLHGRRLRERGFNQAAFLARRVALRLDLPFAPGALRRMRDGAPQRAGGRRARRAGVTGAFAAGARAVRGRRVLLVDDVLTTGATAEACASALRAAGATGVSVVAVARASRDPDPGAPSTGGVVW